MGELIDLRERREEKFREEGNRTNPSFALVKDSTDRVFAVVSFPNFIILSVHVAGEIAAMGDQCIMGMLVNDQHTEMNLYLWNKKTNKVRGYLLDLIDGQSITHIPGLGTPECRFLAFPRKHLGMIGKMSFEEFLDRFTPR